MPKILVVDDEIGIRELLEEILSEDGYDVRIVGTADAARSAIVEFNPDLVLLDIWMPDTDGVSLLKEWASYGQLVVPVIMMSGHATIETAVEATKIGAVAFLEKPISLEKLLVSVKSALSLAEHGKVESYPTLDLFSRSSMMNQLRKRLLKAAASSASLLLYCAPGGAAALCARSLHRANTSWVEKNVLAQPLDSWLKHCEGGTVFVDGVYDLEAEVEANLVQLIEALGHHRIRLVVAVYQNESGFTLPAALTKVWAETSYAWLHVPTLIDFPQEIPEIATQLLSLYMRQNKGNKVFSTAALNALVYHAWHGDFEELSEVVKNLATIAPAERIQEEDVAFVLAKENRTRSGQSAACPIDLDVPFRQAREAFEALYFSHHLEQERGNITQVARRCGLERTHLYRKLKHLGVMSVRS